jgi:hypothetical protein
MNKYKWTKLFSVPGGHRYFRDEITKMIALADNSGSTPDRTEDGVLWLDFQRCVSIVTDVNHTTWISIPVLHESRHGGPVTKSCTPSSSKEAVEVCSRFGLKLALQGVRFVPVQLETAEQGHADRPADQRSQ